MIKRVTEAVKLFVNFWRFFSWDLRFLLPFLVGETSYFSHRLTKRERVGPKISKWVAARRLKLYQCSATTLFVIQRSENTATWSELKINILKKIHVKRTQSSGRNFLWHTLASKSLPTSSVFAVRVWLSKLSHQYRHFFCETSLASVTRISKSLDRRKCS